MPDKKTHKEQRDQKEQHDLWKANREGKRPPKEKGGHRNLLAETLEEEELAEDA